MPSSNKRSSGRVAGCGFIASCQAELSLDSVGKYAMLHVILRCCRQTTWTSRRRRRHAPPLVHVLHCAIRTGRGCILHLKTGKWTRSRRRVLCARGELAEMNVRLKGQDPRRLTIISIPRSPCCHLTRPILVMHLKASLPHCIAPHC